MSTSSVLKTICQALILIAFVHLYQFPFSRDIPSEKKKHQQIAIAFAAIEFDIKIITFTLL